MGENTVKGAKGTKVKVLFQELYMTCIIFVLVYNLNFFHIFKIYKFLKSIIKKKIISSNPFALLIIIVKILSNF
jgi:hypothetical protein